MSTDPALRVLIADDQQLVRAGFRMILATQPGLDVVGEDAAGGDAPRVLILTTFDMDEYVYDALRAGASGFLLKDVPPEHLAAGIRLVHNGEALLAPSITRRLIEEFTSERLRDRVQVVVLAYETGVIVPGLSDETH
jgi:DNA-binding NarL/FixJ family response regulator